MASASPVLDLAFPPEECIWQDEADRYMKTGSPHESYQHDYGAGYWYATPEMLATMQAQAYSLA